MNRRSTVLIIDDEPIARESLEALLAGEDYDLHFAVNGREGLAKASVVKPDAVLLDVMMPGMDGYEVCERLRSDPELSEVAIVMVTALDDRSSRLNGLRAGADEFLSKPFDSMELKTRLQTISRLGRYRRLLAERRRFDWIVESAEDGYVILDQAGAITYANPQARTYLGLGENGVGGQFLDAARRIYHLEPAAAWDEWMVQMGVAQPHYLVRPETSTARSFWLSVEELDLPVPSLGRVVRLHDVTAQMTNYQDMRKFQTAIVHKLRTPLIAMHGSFSLLSTYGHEFSGAEVEGFANTALDGIERLQAEIDDILQFISATTLAEEDFSLGMDDFCTHLNEVAGQVGVSGVEISIDPELENAAFPLSAQAVDTILWELFENARKFHPQHSPNIQVHLNCLPDCKLQILVIDDGVILSPHQLKWAWLPYIQGEKYFTGESPGMGLGLAVVATLVWQVGGEAQLYNRSDRPGVIVDLRVPLHPSE